MGAREEQTLNLMLKALKSTFDVRSSPPTSARIRIKKLKWLLGERLTFIIINYFVILCNKHFPRLYPWKFKALFEGNSGIKNNKLCNSITTQILTFYDALKPLKVRELMRVKYTKHYTINERSQIKMVPFKAIFMGENQS